jgi:hypothetical protein
MRQRNELPPPRRHARRFSRPAPCPVGQREVGRQRRLFGLWGGVTTTL